MKKIILLILGIVFIAIIVAVVVVVGNLKESVKGLQPDIRNISLEWGEVTESSIEVLATLTVYNPNSVSLPVNKVICEIELNGIRVGSAETIDLKIEKKSEFPFRISTKIDPAMIPSVWQEHIRQHEKSEATMHFPELGGKPRRIHHRLSSQLLSAMTILTRSSCRR